VPVVVVDNGSRDLEGARLEAEFGPPIESVRLDPNRGVPGGYNAGIAWAAGRGFTHVLLMNNDTLVSDQDLLAKLVNATGDDVAAVAPITRSADGAVYSAGGRLSYWTGLSSHRSRPLRIDGPYNAAWLDGPCLLVSIAAARAIGGLDETFVTYWEDVDWCVRATRAGWRCVVEPRVSIIHLRGGTNASPKAEVMHLRNRLLFLRRNGSTTNNLVSFVFFLLVHIPAFLVRRVVRRTGLRNAVGMVREAIGWNVRDAWKRRSWLVSASGPRIDSEPR
jgi:GT2 family glycosyltransferase